MQLLLRRAAALSTLGASVLCAMLSRPAAADAPAPKPAPAKVCPAVGAPAPAFTLPRARGGEEIALRALLAQKRPVVIDFWRFDCTPCLLELPLLQKLAGEWGERVSVVTVHHGDPEDRMLDALDKVAVTLPTGFDSYKSVGDRFCVAAYPRLFVVDVSGVVRRIIGADAKPFERVLREAVEPLIAAKAPK